jgi:uncharacterized membrane protein YphA (DoxX/SURF4 family)
MRNFITIKQNRSVISIARLIVKYIPLSSGILLCALLLYAAYNKWSIYRSFVYQLTTSPVVQLFPSKSQSNMAYILSILVPSIEITIPVLFLFKRSRQFAFYCSFFLMLFFTLYVYVIPHFFSDHMPCSCGGIISQLTWQQHFYFNLAFLLLAAAGTISFEYLQKQKDKTRIF